MSRSLFKVIVFLLFGYIGYTFLPVLIDGLYFLLDMLRENAVWLVLLGLQSSLTFICLALWRLDDMDPNQRLEAILNEMKSVRKTLDILLLRQFPDAEAGVIEFYQKINGERVKVDNMFMKIDQVADLAVAFKDKLGNPAKVDGLPTWAVTDESIAKLEVAADGMSAVLSLLAVGKCEVQVKADADLGGGVKEIIGSLEVEVSPLEAELVEISATIRP